MPPLTKNPFPGNTYREEDHPWFFGRSKQIRALQRRLCDQRFLILTGPPHSGKTSLVFGGVIPQFKERGYKGLMGTKWRVAHFIPSNHTVEQLTKAIARRNLLHPDEKLSPTYQDRIRAILRKGNDGLIRAYRQSDSIQSYNFLIVLDQCESFFSQKPDADKEQLIQLLLTASQAPDIPIYVLMIFRDQSLPDLHNYPALAENTTDFTFRLHFMGPAELKEAIQGPISRAKVQMEEKVVQKLLEQLSADPKQLTSLQSVLSQLWKVWYKEDRGTGAITMNHLSRVNKDANERIEIRTKEERTAIQIKESNPANTEDSLLGETSEPVVEEPVILAPSSNGEILEQLWQNHPESDQIGLMKIFKAMTQKNVETKGRLEKRTVMIEDLANIVGFAPNKLISLIDQIRKEAKKALLPEEGVLDLFASVEMADLSLVEEWPRLSKWIEEEKADANQFLAIANAANEKATLDPTQLSRAARWWEEFSPTAAWGNQYYYGFKAIETFVQPHMKSTPKTQQISPTPPETIQETSTPPLPQKNSPTKPSKPKIKIKGKRA